MNIRHLRPRAIVFLAAMAFAVVISGGCKSPESKVIGTWNGPNSVSITFKEDKTFSQGGQMPVTGKWSISDKKVTVNVETVNGKSPKDLIDQIKKLGAPADTVKKAEEQLKKGMELTLAEDGKTMSMVAGGQTMTLTKADAK